ncbi:iron complex transport system permease protein [Marinobacterium mangrovicola]|uniref:Iron complex transport system permease protein n=1 Tax=Marinobacterium mangrovicola TaxID=1476959 RepID=A0A4R1GKV0_9GAMM|nr:iron ABC transporter permease [Marinobacterium mangrovicola]TCK07595.1 iron complex transport system permease protein [Marinobacterium mangrovicola]
MNAELPLSSTLPGSTAPRGYWLLKGRLGSRQLSVLVPRRSVAVNLTLLVLTLAAATASLCMGSMSLSPAEVWTALWGEGPALHKLVVQELRLHRVLAGFATGAAFALSGCLMQTLARNRLATPGIIGIDNAATAFAVASVIGTGIALAPPAMSLVGAATATALAFGLSGDNGSRGYRFIIAGVAIGAISGAITQFMLSRVAIDDANAAFPWTVGSLNARSKEATLLLGAALLPCLLLALRWASSLRLVQVSEAVSIGLGINLKRVRRNGLILSVLLTGLAVAVAGPVGLVALIGPELARTLCRHRGVPLLASTLCGALLMLLADLTGRMMLAPLEIPVGIVTAVVGSPYLLWMLLNPSFRSQP